MAAAPASSRNPLREGRAADLWSLAIVALVGLSLGSILRDLRFQPTVTPASWWLYFAAQVLNKAPISYRYTRRGPHAAIDLTTFGLGLLGVAWTATGAPPPSTAVGWLLASTVSAGFALGVAVQVRESPGSPPLARRVYCALVAYLLPGLPMCFAWLAVLDA
jgi:hypothetical protein